MNKHFQIHAGFCRSRKASDMEKVAKKALLMLFSSRNDNEYELIARSKHQGGKQPHALKLWMRMSWHRILWVIKINELKE